MTGGIVDYWWALLAAAAAAGVYVFVLNLEKKRREAYETFCLARGFRFEKGRPGGQEAYAGTIPLFNRGHGRRWGYTFSGRRNGQPFTAFEYRYTTGGGKSSLTHRVVVLLWEPPELPLPEFCLTPEGFWDRVGQRLGVQDIDFPVDPGFSRAYQLQGDDEAAVRKLFTPAARNFLAANAGHQVAGGASCLAWWRPGRLPRPDDLDGFLAEGDGIRRMFLEA